MAKIKKAQKGMTMVQLKKKYPKADTTAMGDTRYEDFSGAYRDKKMYQFVQDADAAFDRKYGKGKLAVDTPAPSKKKKKMQAGGTVKSTAKSPNKKGAFIDVQKRTLGNMKKGGKMSKKK
jgi:hypothetical protein